MNDVYFRKSIGALFLFIGLLGYTYTYADNSQGLVANMITGGDIVYFKIGGATYASCSAHQRYVIHTGTVFGKNAYAMLLTAYALGKPVGVVSIGGSNPCSIMSNDAETVVNVYIP